MRSKTTYLLLGVLAALCLASPLSAQKAGQITKATATAAFVDQPPARPTLKLTTVAATTGTRVNWRDVLRTEDGGRIRAQLNDGSILSIGQKTKLTINKHDERTQQSSFELGYGQVRATVMHLSGSDSAFEIRTQTAVCGVLGTDEGVETDGPVATVVIAISGVVTVKSSNPNVVGSVQLSPGQTTTVNQGQPPTGARPATPGQLNNLLNNTGGSTNPDPTVSNATPSLQIGKPLTIDGRASTGGLGSIASYNWAIDNALNQVVYTATNPVLSIDTATWAPGVYTGTLTVTNTATPPQSATVSFTFTLAAPDPGPTIPALAAAYQTGQERTFMNLFDSVHYVGYSALAQSITQSFNNITVTGVNILTSAGASTGAATAHYNVTMQIGYTLKNTSLPVTTTTGGTSAAPAQLRVSDLRSGAAATGAGSISGSTGAVATFVVLGGPQTGVVQSGTNSLGYSFTGLPDGTYSVTPQRSGFNFSPASLTVTIKNGAAISGANFTAQPQPLTITANAILDLGYQPNAGWLFTNLSGSLGGAGILGVPGTNNPTAGLSTGTGTGTGTGTNNPPAAVPTFTITPSSTPAPLVVGNHTATIPVTITPLNGFLGNIAMNFTFATGISLVSGPTTVNITSNSPVTVDYVFAASASANPGSAGVLYAATSGTIGPVFGEVSLAVTQVGGVVVGHGASQPDPLQLLAGNGNGTVSMVISPVLPGESLSVSAPVGGLNTAFSAIDSSGKATLTVTPTGSTIGLQTIIVNISVNGSVANSFPIYVNLVPPVIKVTAPASVNVAPGQPATVGITVQFATGFIGPVKVTPPANGGGLSFSPSFVNLNISGTANFTVTASQAFVQSLRQGAAAVAGDFTITAGGYTTTASVSFTTLAAADFNLSVGNSLTLKQNDSGSLTINVTQTGGTANIPITVSAGGFPTGISAAPAGSNVTNGSGSVTFNVSALFTAASGTQTFTVTGNSGTIFHSIPVTITIISGSSFNLSADLKGTVYDGGGLCSNCITVTVTALGTFTTPVTITPSSPVAVVNGPATISPGSSGQYGVTATGPGRITFTGTANGITQTATVDFAPVAGFTLGVSATNSFPGGSSTVTVVVNRLSGFQGAVVITPAPSPGVGLSPSSVTIQSGATTTTFTASIANAATGNSVAANFSATAQGGSIAVAGTGAISLTGAPFALSGGSVAGFSGQDVPIIVTVLRTNGVGGAVLVQPTSGVTGVIITPSSVTVPAGSTTANFVATIPVGVTIGGTIQFSGTLVGGTFSANTSVTLTIKAPFTLGTGSSLGSIVPGGKTTGQVSLTLATGFSGPVSLSAATTSGSATGSFAVQQVSASGNVTLTVTAAATAAAGPSTIVVTAASGTYSVTATYTVSIVTAFSAQASSPASLTVFNGSSNTVSVSVVYASAFTGSVTSTISAPAGINAVVQGSGSLNGSGSISYTISAPTSGGGSGPVTVTLSGGNTTVQITFNLTVVVPYSVSMPNTTAQVFSSLPTTVSVSVAVAQGFTSPVTVGAPPTMPAGILSVTPSAVTLTNGGTATFTVTGTAQNVAATNGTLGFNSAGAGYSASTGQNYTVIDPYSLSVTPPSNVVAPSTVPYGVTVVPNNNFQGQVTLTPSVMPTGGTASVTFPTGTTVPVSTSTPVTFSVTLGTGVSSMVLSTATSTGAFSLSTGSSTIPVTGSYSVAVTSGTAKVFSGLSTTITVQVTYIGSYSATVTITPPSPPSGFASIQTISCDTAAQPAGRGRTPAARNTRGDSGAATVTPGNNTACFIATGGTTNVSLSTGTLVFTTSDGNGNNNSASTPYQLQDPFSLAPSATQPGTPFSLNENIVANLGFTGYVTITPSLTAVGGSVAPSSNPPSPVFVSGTTQVTLSANPDANVTSFTGSIVFSTGSFILSQIVPTQYVTGYTLASTPSSQVNLFTGLGKFITITAAYVSPFTGQITLNAPVLTGYNFTFCVVGSSPCSAIGPNATITTSATQAQLLMTTAGTNTSNTSVATGQFTVTSSATNVANQPSVTLNYAVEDPYSLTVTTPTGLVDGGTGTYSITIKPNTVNTQTFSGNVNVTPKSTVTPSNDTVGFTPSGTQVVNVPVSGNTTVSFTVNVGTGVTGVGFTASTTVGGFSLSNVGSAQPVSVPYTVGVTNTGTTTIFSGTSAAIFVQVNYVGSYNATVTITAPNAPAGIASISAGCAGSAEPARLGRGVPSGLASSRGPRGIQATVMVTPQQNTACFTVTANNSGNVAPGFTGNLNFTTNDTNNNSNSTSAAYTAIDPYSLSMPQGTVNVYPSFQTQASVTVTYNAGFSASVSVGALSTNPTPGIASISSAQTASGTTTLSFTLTGNSTTTGCPANCGNLIFAGTSTGAGSFTPPQAQEQYQVNAPITSASGVTSPATMPPGGTGVLTYSVTPGPGFSGSVSITESSNLPTGMTFVGASTSPTGPFSGSSVSGYIQNSTAFLAYFQFAATAGTAPQTQFVSFLVQTTGFQGGMPGAVEVQPSSLFVLGSGFSSGNLNVFSTTQFTQMIDVAYANGYNATVTITGPASASGFSNITEQGTGKATPLNPQVTFAFTASGSNPGPNGTSGSMQFSGTDGTNTKNYTLNYDVVDPVTITTTPPNMLVQGTTQNYTVTLTSNSGYSGNVTIMPSITSTPASTANISNLTGMIVPVSANQSITVTFTVTSAANTTGLVLGGTVSAPIVTPAQTTTFSANLPQSTVNFLPFTITAPASPLIVYDSIATTSTVTLHFANGYNGSVTVSCTSIGALSFGASPARRDRNPSPGQSGRRVANDPSAGNCGGNGVGSITLPNNTNPVASNGGTVNVTFTVTGNGQGSGNINFQATDGSTVATATQPFAAAEPVSLSVVSSPPVNIFSNLATSVNVQVTDINSFNGTVSVSAPTITGITFSPTSQMAVGSTVLVFTATGSVTNPNNSTGTISFSAAAGNITSPSVGYNLRDPFSLSINSLTGLTTGNSTMTVTVVPNNGFFGSVTVAPSASGTGVTASLITSRTVLVSGNTPVTFTLTLSNSTGAPTESVQLDACGSTTTTCPTTAVGTFFVFAPSYTPGVTPPFTLTASPNPVVVTSTTNVQMTVTVNFAQGFVGSVMVGCATITSSGINTASVSPGGRRPDARRGAALPPSCSGLGIGSVTPDPNNVSATVFASGSGGSASLIFDVMGAGAGSGVINLQGVDTVGDTASYKAPFTATPQANTGVVTAGSASGSAGSTVNVPITLALSAGTSLDTVSFGFQVTPNPSAPAITTGILSFVDGISAPTSQVDTGAGPNIINVSWLNLSTALGGNVTLGNVVVKIPANATSGQTYTLNITGARGSFQGNAVTLTAGTNAILTSASISLARKDAAPRTASASRMTVTARNENCAGVRFASSSQSGCGGSVDVEVQPVITAAGVLEVHLAIPNGGIVDLGAMALAGAQFPDADSGTQALAPQGQFLQGHTYLVKLGNQLALVRVARIRSTVSPRLAAIPGGSSRNPTVGRNGNSDLLGSMREQQQMNNVLNNAQITIDLEWLMQQPNP